LTPRGRPGKGEAGFFGGFASQDDSAKMMLLFLFEDGSYEERELGGVTPLERNSTTGLLYRSIRGRIPANVTALEVTVLFRSWQGPANDGYADELSFRIQKD